ncbi:MAG: hypothetical protein WAV28_03415 [Sedimentisphaerales bacterium]
MSVIRVLTHVKAKDWELGSLHQTASRQLRVAVGCWGWTVVSWCAGQICIDWKSSGLEEDRSRQWHFLPMMY